MNRFSRRPHILGLALAGAILALWQLGLLEAAALTVAFVVAAGGTLAIATGAPSVREALARVLGWLERRAKR